MYSFKKEDKDNLDELDKKFIETKTADKKLELYGLHTYGGYHGFFRPDIYEAIGLLNDYITVDDLESIEKIYLTTEPHPNDNINNCFDYKKDRHRAKTVCYLFYKTNKDDRSAKRLKID